MTVPSNKRWPYRHALVLISIAFLLAMGSMVSSSWVGTPLLVAAVVVALVAAMRFWQARRSAHSRRPFI
jgi:Flp pilus assembly protein TadB